MAAPATSLKLSPASAIRDYVVASQGHTVIERVLIANNGIAAVKEIRSIRKWAYETFADECMIKFIVMATPEDLQYNADYIRMADHYIEVPGGTNNHNYANVDLIVDIAQRCGAQAVWAGWGHASENPKLPEKLKEKGIVFIGPPGFAMRSLGDKISSTIVAQAAGVPTMSWSGDGLTTDARTPEGYITVPEDTYLSACVTSAKEAVECARRLGYPLMIKASEGGGGKGIRKVTEPESFDTAFAQVSSEVPGSPIFLMKLATNARHLEVQVLADDHGNVISLFGRDCSVQRRHQKIIEEAPVTIAPEALFEQMEMSAVRLAKMVGYVNAGTVEFLYDLERGQYYFLELNPRLQVEHPTTEMVSGVNIPAAQLQVAMGIPLHRIRDIRLLYGLQPHTTSTIDFHFEDPASRTVQRKPTPKGHVIACRITAENPDAGFKPSGGNLMELNFRSSTNVWGYFSVSARGGLHEYADSQFGHIFAYGTDREQSRRSMIMALKELSIRGDFRTTIEYLIKLLETDVFSENCFNTAWLDGLIEQNVRAERPDLWVSVVCGAACKAHTAYDGTMALWKTALEKGQIPSLASLKTEFKFDIVLDNVKYPMQVCMTGPERYSLTLQSNPHGPSIDVLAKSLSDGGTLVTMDMLSYVVYSKEEVQGDRLSINGKTVVLEKESDPTKLRSPSPGKLVRWLIPDGGVIQAGKCYAEVEVMKMIMPLLSTESGRLKHERQEGSPIQAGDLLASLVLDDPSKVRTSKLYTGTLPPVRNATSQGGKPHQVLHELRTSMELTLKGYRGCRNVDDTVDQFFAVVQDVEVPRGEAFEILSSISSRVPPSLETALSTLLHKDDKVFPAKEALEILDSECVRALNEGVSNIYAVVHPLQVLFDAYKGGVDAFECLAVSKLLQQYVEVEALFSTSALHKTEDILLSVRESYKDLGVLVQVVLSHAKVKVKNTLISALLDRVVRRPIYSRNTAIVADLKALADLSTSGSAPISLKARETLLHLQLPSVNERAQGVAQVLARAVDNNSQTPHTESLRELICTNYSLFDVLPMFFYDADPRICAAALETYIRRAYQAYDVHETTVRRFKPMPKSDSKFDLDDDWSELDDDTTSSSSGSEASSSTPPMMLEWTFHFPTYDDEQDESQADKISQQQRNVSVSDLTLLVGNNEEAPLRTGVMAAFESLSSLHAHFESVLSNLPLQRKPPQSPTARPSSTEPWNVVNICIKRAPDNTIDDRALSDILSKAIAPFVHTLRSHGVRRITFMVYKKGQYPRYFTFRERSSYAEDAIIRHIEPSHAFHLELKRLSNFNITPVPTTNRNIHMYYAVGIQNAADCRFFVTAIARPGRSSASNLPTLEYLISEGDRLLASILDSLEIASASYKNTDCNHLFLNFVPHFDIHPSHIQDSLKGFLERHGRRLWKLRVVTAEVRFLIINRNGRKSHSRHNSGSGRRSPQHLRSNSTGSLSNFSSAVFQPPERDPQYLPTPHRFIVTNVSGVLKFETYREVKGASGNTVFQCLSGEGMWNNMDVSSPHPIKEKIQPKRYRAHLLGTTYVYDFVELFREAVLAQWRKYAAKYPDSPVQRPAVLLKAQELALDADDKLQPVTRPAGSNTCGMVAWLMEMFTPECPRGRKIIVIANDITFAIGSFGPVEDRLFYLASQMARQLGVPRIYVSANSGARIGLADEVLPAFKVAWVDEQDKTKGYRYVYLTPDDYARLNASSTAPSVIAEEVQEEGGERRMKIVSVIGQKDGLGVENLRGSGLIAGESSRAYEDIFTITLVACRSVGIGAYLVRLGQRTIQTEGQPIILTGAAALNKVLGREVYTSNLQLGGTQIMHANGVAHLTCVDNVQGVHQIVDWLSYVPAHRGAPLPIVDVASQWDPVDRDIAFVPPKTPYDPRHMLAGHFAEPTGEEEDKRWISGFFDRDSFVETLTGWSKTVVVGRARLGGIPMGVIVTETRTMENRVPADPANPSSEEQLVMEAAGVWTPASSFKTAQAINDFNKGEQLPLIIFANWRGFSGGQRDMYDAILKYGSHIVDALRAYKQPVFIYIVPNGELRGGAWVVLDPTINADMMEMYADEKARGGVLEPEGIVEIKYRMPQITATMERLDEQYSSLKKRLADSTLGADERRALQVECDARERQLYPTFYQVALHFADLHDTPGRMLAKRTISKILSWQTARSYFYWRLRRRLAEETLRKRIAHARSYSTTTTTADDRSQATALLQRWFADDVEGGSVESFATADKQVVAWLESPNTRVNERITAMENEHISTLLARLMRERPEAASNSMLHLLRSLPPQ
ncbi:acetyl-coenzyme-A carboxylase [Sorochytrium milnesiophthora]